MSQDLNDIIIIIIIIQYCVMLWLYSPPYTHHIEAADNVIKKQQHCNRTTPDTLIKSQLNLSLWYISVYNLHKIESLWCSESITELEAFGDIVVGTCVISPSA